MRTIHWVSALILAMAGWAAIAAPSALAASAKAIETLDNKDYFGFDLRSEQNLTLSQCKTACLGDNQCRAFTYNTKAKWCFLKSDFATLKPFNGAVAGKVVIIDGEPDIGAPPAIAFFPTWMADEAWQYRAMLTAAPSAGDAGLMGLTEAAEKGLLAGDARGAAANYVAAIAIAPDDGDLWLGLAKANLAISGKDSSETATLARTATSAAWNGYQLLRTKAKRAEVLAVIATGLDRRDLFRPALQAYEASLALVRSASIQAEYEDLKARKGFRVIEHTVDADTATPRVCAQFSESLVKTGVDYAPFVTVDDAAPKSVEAKDNQVCIEGLEHGKRYRVAFRAGLPAAIGEVLTAPVVLDIYVQDRGASVRFTGDSFVLPAKARRGIPVVTVNMATASMNLYRIGDRSLAQLLSGYQFLRQIDGYDLESIRDQIGEPVWSGKLDIANELNTEITTSFPVDEALPTRKPGVYVLTAQPEKDAADDWSSRATQWFVVSDIGLSTYTGQDGINVFARSLGSAKPIANADLTLLARNNEILGTAKTDAEGHAVFSAGLTRGAGGMVPAVMMASAGGEDFVFLDMSRAGFDLSDRGVTGRATAGALDVYTWTERGIYRAGETVHVAALARDDTAHAVEKLPLTFIFSRPDGVEDRRTVSDGAEAGGHTVDLALSPDAMRGTWTVSVYTDPKQPAVSSQAFLVEDFVPDRIEFSLASDKDKIAVGDPATVTVDGRFLYGAPAAGLALEGEITVSKTREWEDFPRYQFGLADEEAGDDTRIPLANLPLAGEDGKASFPVQVDALPSTTQFLTSEVTVRMRESGGRAVEEKIEIGIKSQIDAIGIRPEFSDSVPEGGLAKFSIIAVDPNGARKALTGARWSLVKVERNYQWYRSSDAWSYEPVTFTKAVADGTVDVAADGSAMISMPVDWGRYRLEVDSAEPNGPVSSVEFDSGWYVASTSTETPDGLEIALDKDHYAPGEIAKLKVSPRFAGGLLVTVGADRLLTTLSATVPEGGATIDVPVSAEWGAGAYVTATLFRPGDAQESRMPARAIGLKWLTVDPGARKLAVALSPAARGAPRQPLTVPVAVTGLPAMTDAYVTIAAVDVGILNLTDYKAPDPDGFYYGQRKMGLELRDIYGRLIDGSLGAAGRLRTGGDGSGLTAQGKPPTEKLVAFFSGIVKLDTDGKATVDFDIPQFNGTVRIMAVAWTKDAVGHASSDVIIRDPVVITAGLPRFLAPGDKAVMRLDIANTDAPDGDYQFAVETTGDLSTGEDPLPEMVSLTAGKRQSITVPLVARTAGDAGLTIRLANSAGVSVEQHLSIPVRPATLPVTNRMVVDLGPNGASLRVDQGLLAASVLPGAYVSVGVSPSAAFDVPSLLLALDRYPYGCSEQTTSRALPLLYVNELAAGAGVNDDPLLKGRVQDAIYRVLNNQSSSGSFGLWGPGSGDLWLDSYVTDFLTRARELNYDVPREAMLRALGNLQNALGYDLDLEDRGGEIAYALYVLARNKKASVGDLRYYADTKLEAFTSPLAVAQIAASLSLYGDPQRAEATFKAALQLAKSQPEYDYSRGDYGSKLRDGAAMLSLAAESQPMPSVVPQLIAMVSADRKAARWTTTQDDAWTLLAARGLRKNAADMKLKINGVDHTGVYAERFDGETLVESPVVIANAGATTVQAVMTAVAAPVEPLPAGGDGFSIERTYYKLDGTEANVTEVAQNERFVVVLKVDEDNTWPSRVLVSDLLPAGFEIDNPGLVSSADLSNFTWLERTEAAHLEFRDDRFIAAFDRNADSPRSVTLAYVVRAVTPGVYAHPAASVEDMYRPQYSARTAAGMMEVKVP